MQGLLAMVTALPAESELILSELCASSERERSGVFYSQRFGSVAVSGVIWVTATRDLEFRGGVSIFDSFAAHVMADAAAPFRVAIRVGNATYSIVIMIIVDLSKQAKRFEVGVSSPQDGAVVHWLDFV